MMHNVKLTGLVQTRSASQDRQEVGTSTMNPLHALIDAHAERCKAETRAIVQEALDRISIKVGFWIRSDAQKRRWERAQKVIAKNEKSGL